MLLRSREDKGRKAPALQGKVAAAGIPSLVPSFGLLPWIVLTDKKLVFGDKSRIGVYAHTVICSGGAGV